MKKILFAFYIESRLLLHDIEKVIEKALWLAKKSITPVVLGFAFWVAYQLINGFTK